MRPLLILTTLLLALNACNGPVDAQKQPPLQSSSEIYFPDAVAPSGPIQTELMTIWLDTLSTGITSPWGIAFLNDGIVLVTERDGALRRFVNGALDPTPVSGLPEVYVRGQGGLLDVEPHPNYAENGWIYLSYSLPGDGGGHTAVMRAKLDGNNLTDQQVLFEGGPFTRSRVHFGSRLQFDRNGDLFFSIGDRGAMDDAQNLDHYSGNVFRIRDDGSIPSDNPFYGRADAKPEIYSYGHRNPQGMAIHPVTGAIWTHEHGPRGGDEINIIRPGRNYGWPVITYGIDYDGSIISHLREKEGMEQPVHYWDPSIAPSGMEFVWSDRYPKWKNQMIVGALRFQLLARVELDGERYVREERFLEGIGRVREVEMGPDGYLYVLTESPSALYRILPEKP